MMPCPSVVRSSRRPSVRPSVRPRPSKGGVGGDVLLKIYDLAKPSEANGDGDVVGYLLLLLLLLSELISAGFERAI